MSNGVHTLNIISLVTGIVKPLVMWRMGLTSEAKALTEIEAAFIQALGDFVNSSEGVTHEIGAALVPLAGIASSALNDAILHNDNKSTDTTAAK